MTELLLTLIYSLLLARILFKWKFFSDAGLNKVVFPAIFFLKVITGFAAGYFFITYRGGSDMDWYMYETNFLFDAVREKPLLFFKFVCGIEDAETVRHTALITSWNATDFFYNDARTLLRINLLLRIFSFGYTNVHVIFFCFFSVTGFAGLFRFFKKYIPVNNLILIAAIVFIPSVFLWTSLLLKETLLIFFLGIFLFSVSRINSGRGIVRYIIPFFSFILLFTIKPFAILLLLPPFIAFYISLNQSPKKIVTAYFLCYAATLLVLIAAGHLSGNKTLPQIIALKQQSSMKFTIFKGAKNYFRPPVIASTWISIAKNSPQAIANIFTIPEISGNYSRGMKLFSIENYLLVVAFLSFIAYAIKNRITPDWNILLLCFLFSLSYFILTGLTTADAGALIRYKLPALIFFYTGCISLLKEEEEPIS